MKKPSFAIVGCGRVGTALAKHLSSAGYRLAGISCASEATTKAAAVIAGTESCSTVPWEITKDAAIVFITTPDSTITGTCETIAENDGFGENTVVLHCSGAHPSTILSSAKSKGADIGSMHPLQSFASEGSGSTFEGITISIEGDGPAIDAACRMTDSLGAKRLLIKTGAKTLYHASAVAACNYLVTLQGFALKMMEEAGVSGKDAIDVLYPLIKGTLSNIENVGIEDALTGPVARGDAETVQRHICEIKEKTPEFLVLYKTLGLYTVDIALTGGSISENTAKELKRIFS